MAIDRPGRSAVEESRAAPVEKRARLGARLARGAFVVIWVVLIVFQVGFLWHLGDNLNYLGDSHAEADAMRAAEAYIADGISSHHGLARILYGTRFPEEGSVKDHVERNGQVAEKFSHDFPAELKDRNQWPLTHYPPGAELINGFQARTFGLHPMWRLRLLPVAVGLMGLAYFFRTISLIWGVERSALIAVAVVVLPAVWLWMPTLEFEGYALALVMIQTGLVMRQFWQTEGEGREEIFRAETLIPRGATGSSPQPSPILKGRGRAMAGIGVWLPVALFLIGFVQGWLSWDHFFVVSLLALPWWLLRRGEGENLRWSWLFWMTAPAAAGYALAHVLHAWEVAAELGGWQAALNELLRTGAERGGFTSEEHVSRLGYTGRAIHLYLRWCFKPIRPPNVTFGPFFGLLLVVALCATLFPLRKLTIGGRPGKPPWNLALFWPGKRSPMPALGAALLISTLWLLAMPSHTAGNAHYLVRHMIVFYLCMAMVVARSVHVWRGDTPATAGP
jgi:hypothetical protein